MSGPLQTILHHFELPLQNPVLVFSLILFIILLAPILLRKLNVPGIIGLIISGVIIGPNGLNVLEKNSAVELFSTIGLLYIMFIAGLELDMHEFKLNRSKSLVFGLFTFALPLLIGYPICKYLLGYDSSASFLIASMFATHTLVSYPIVSKLGVSKNQAVAITVGGTILTDTAVLLILAIVIGGSKGQLTYDFWLRMGISLSVFSVIMFALVPRLAKWFFSRLESEKHSHYIFVLSIVFFAAFLAEMAGVEPIIGAFVSGLALNRLIPHSSALMNRIEFIGNSLFIPFFLVSVGMLVDLRVVLTGMDALIIALTLTTVALLGKWLAALATQTFFGYSVAQRQLIFGLSSAHAAATLAVILVGFNAGILDENVLNGTVILILITCVVASFTTERASKRLLKEVYEPTAHSDRNPMQNEKILIPIANVENFGSLLDLTVLIKDKHSKSPISVLSVVSNDHEAEMNIVNARNKLEKFVKQGSASETNVNVITTIDHNAASGISRIAKEVGCQLIMIGWPQRSGFIDKIIGEKVDSILSNIDRTIFVCRIIKPLILCKRLIVHAPSFTEREHGFELWVSKVALLSRELSVPLLLHSSMNVAESVRKIISDRQINANLDHVPTTSFDEIDQEPHTNSDLLIIISARKGSVSHHPSFESLPQRMEKSCAQNNLIIIYPQQFQLNP